MLWKVSRILLLLMVSLHAGPYLDLHRKLALEMKEPKEKIAGFEKWIKDKSGQCREQFRFEDKQACLARIVHQDTRIRFDSTQAMGASDLLPMRLVDRKYGSCLSISFLVLVLAESMGMRGEPVSLPGHVYIHFVGGVNWESNREGYAYTDEEYRKKYDLDGSRGRIARTLDHPEFEGLFRYEWANRLAAQQRNLEALHQYQIAQEHWRDARIPGNRALLLENMGQPQKARALLDSLWKVGARSEELVWNRALVMMRGSEALEIVLLFLEEAEGRRIGSERLRNLRKRIQQELAQ